LLRLAGLREDQMPDASAPGAVIGEVTPEAAALCGLPAGLPIVAGLGDGQAAGLGASVAAPGLAYLNLGTAVVSGTITDTFVVDRAFRTMYGGAPGTYSPETVIIGGTYTVSWFVREFAAEMAAVGRPGSTEEALEAACRDLPPGASGLMLVPYWNSAMNPYWDASASGIVAGWRGIHGKAHLYRAILEGIAYEQRLHTSGVEAALGRSIDSYVAIGGGARSALWRQIIADVTGKTVLRSSTTEAAALGAGILAARGAGLFGDVAEASAAMAQRDTQRVEPDAANHATYSRLYDEVYRHLYPALQPYLQRLTELSEAST
jgi:xylulokinase